MTLKLRLPHAMDEVVNQQFCCGVVFPLDSQLQRSLAALLACVHTGADSLCAELLVVLLK
jgi:hypothetical protein